MATIKEIAAKAKVSPATVSRVLNYDQTLSVSDEKRASILKVAEALNYVTPRRRSDKKIKSNVKIALIHWYSITQEVNDPYYMSIRISIEKACYENNIDIIKIYDPSNYDFKHMAKVDGIIAIGKFSQQEVDKFAMISSDIVFVDSSPEEKLYDSVVIDFESAVTEVLDYLSNAGHDHIGYIGGREYVGRELMSIEETREQVFKSYLLKKNLLNEKQIYVGRFDASSGYELMLSAIKSSESLPSAFLIASDSMAIGALRALHEMGIHVPKDVALVGFNDLPISQYTQPPLTSVRVHKSFMGETAVQLLMERLLHNRSIAKKVVVPTELIIRESSKGYSVNKGDNS